MADGDESQCGKLMMSMYGTRDAALNWALEYGDTLKAAGYEQGKANPCLFYHHDLDVSVMVHGDDFVAVGPDKHLENIENTLSEKYKIKIEQLGYGGDSTREIRILNKVVRMNDTGIELEADPRHAELVRFEKFGEGSEMFAFSAFYKDFTDPIELTFYESAPDQITPKNLGAAKVYGLEFEFRKSLGFVLEGLKDLKFNVNASYINSELTMNIDEYNRRVLAARDGESIKKTRDLQGQSPYLINSGLNYNNSDIGLQTGLFFNVQGKTLEVVGTGIVPDVYTKPFSSLNFTFNKSFGEDKKSTIDVKVSNILNSKRESVYESYKTTAQTFSRYQPGTEISIGYSYKF